MVVPVYDEMDSLAPLVDELLETLRPLGRTFEIILVNGESVDFSHLVSHGDRVSVYPQFESLDITPLLRVRERPLRTPRFIADAHLGALARNLRMLGYDVHLDEALDDAQIAELSARQHRIITHGCYVREAKPHRQLKEIVTRLDLLAAMAPFTRCMECNAELADVDKDDIVHRLPAGTAEYYDRFRICPGCKKIYWPGSHHQRMCALIDELSVGEA